MYAEGEQGYDVIEEVVKKRAAVVCLTLVVTAATGAGASGCAVRTLGKVTGDDVLKTRVETALAGASDVNADGLTVAASRGVVTLTGYVASGTEQQSVGAIVRAIPGVEGVAFSLASEPPDSGAPR